MTIIIFTSQLPLLFVSPKKSVYWIAFSHTRSAGSKIPSMTPENDSTLKDNMLVDVPLKDNAVSI
jgi:hypothetical protein